MIRVEKTKRIRSAVNFYKNSFAMHPPYMVVCDGNFLFAALDRKIALQQSFTDVFRGQIYLKVPDCIMSEVRSLVGDEFRRLQTLVRESCQKFRCAHRPRNPHQCIVDTLRCGFVGAVATQDQGLRRVIHRDYPKTPVFFITQQLQICPPPKSLRAKVQAELTEKYAPKRSEGDRPPGEADVADEEGDGDEKDDEIPRARPSAPV
jgi:rRNA-processing protein FCF1